MEKMKPLNIVLQYTAFWKAVVMDISFYPLIVLLVGGIFLNIQHGSMFAFSVVMHFAWVVLTAPLWFLGQHWITALQPRGQLTTIEPLQGHLIGYYLILLSLVVLAIMLLWRIPQIIFSTYYLSNGAAQPLKESQQLTTGKYLFLLVRVLLLSLISVCIQISISFMFTNIPGLFFPLYSPGYISWMEWTRTLGTIFGSLTTSILWMWYFFGVWQKLKKST